MRKFYLAIASCVALVAFMGLSATAFGLADPRCEAEPGGNQQEILDFTIDTPDSRYQGDVSRLTGGAYACGSDISPGWGGEGSLNNHADIGLPPGFQVSDTDLVPVGSRAGTARVKMLYHHPFFGTANYEDGEDGTGVLTQTFTADKAECQNELDTQIKGATPGNEPGSSGIIVCLKSTSPSGWGWQWNVRDADGKSWTTIGPMHADYGVDPGLTYVKLELCAYLGAVGSADCGSEENGDQFQQKNGWKSYRVCDNAGRGIFTVTATMENESVTPVASDCVSWYPWPCISIVTIGGVRGCSAPHEDQPPTKPRTLTESMPPQ